MIYRFGPYRLDTNRLELQCGEIDVAVEPQVFSLILLLIENKDRVVSKDELIAKVWDGRIVSDATLSSRVSAARRALGDDGKRQTVIRTVARRGFRFVADVQVFAEEELDASTAEPSDSSVEDEALQVPTVQTSAVISNPFTDDGDGSPARFFSAFGHRVIRWRWAIVAAAVVIVAASLLLERTAFQDPEGASSDSEAIDAWSDKPSIAVLPFANMSGDPEQEYFADGITEDIITGLSKFRLFLVVSRNSSFAYKDQAVDLDTVAEELGVQYVLEGSVRRSGDQVRVTVQLIDAASDTHLWAEKYDIDFDEILDVQDKITDSIVTTVAPEFLSAEMRRATRKDPRNLDAWDAFMRGYWHFLRFTRTDNKTAQRLFEQAIAADPAQASYHGMMAVTHQMDALYGWSESRDESLRRAFDTAEHGLALNDQDPLVLRALGLANFFAKNHEAAADFYARAVAANPDEAENHALLGAALGVAGSYEDARHHFDIAMRLSPRDVHIATWYNYLAIAAFVSENEAEAAEWSRKTIRANPQFPGGYRSLAASAGALGHSDEAVAAREKLQELMPAATVTQLREKSSVLQRGRCSREIPRWAAPSRSSGMTVMRDRKIKSRGAAGEAALIIAIKRLRSESLG